MDFACIKRPELPDDWYARFETPNVDAPITLGAELEKIPADATISGMFLAPMAEEAIRRGRPLPSARARYTKFTFYPVTEHVTLLFEAAQVLFPSSSLRKGLRKLGRAASSALLQSTLGRVVLSGAVTPAETIAAMAKAYEINLKPGCEARVLESGPGFSVVELKNVFYLLDSHHVGAMEGLLRPLGIRPDVKVRSIGTGHAELLVCWPE